MKLQGTIIQIIKWEKKDDYVNVKNNPDKWDLIVIGSKIDSEYNSKSFFRS